MQIQPVHKSKTAFISRYSTFEYMVMPLGLTNMPATFQDLMNSVFFYLLNDFLIVYLDNLLVYSASNLEYFAYLWIVFECLHTH